MTAKTSPLLAKLAARHAANAAVREGFDPAAEAANAEDYDAELELARHLLHDEGVVTPFVRSVLSEAEIVRATGAA